MNLCIINLQTSHSLLWVEVSSVTKVNLMHFTHLMFRALWGTYHFTLYYSRETVTPFPIFKKWPLRSQFQYTSHVICYVVHALSWISLTALCIIWLFGVERLVWCARHRKSGYMIDWNTIRRCNPPKSPWRTWLYLFMPSWVLLFTNVQDDTYPSLAQYVASQKTLQVTHLKLQLAYLNKIQSYDAFT